MSNAIYSFSIKDFQQTRQQVLSWMNQFSTCCFLDSHHYSQSHHSYECIGGAGIRASVTAQAGHALAAFQQFTQESGRWFFGHLGYDLKNEFEALHSRHPDHIGFPDLFFFEPEFVVQLNDASLRISAADEAEATKAFNDIRDMPVNIFQQGVPVKFQPRFSRHQYIDTIEELRRHILRGDCYEINFCQEFFAEKAMIDPVGAYIELSRLSPAPFAALYKHNKRFLLCASPERYLKKTGNAILSQPIKGTARRDLDDSGIDLAYKDSLYKSAKDRAENVMVVDIVRNDLSRICVQGTVKVDELFGIYSFAQVHQMISTVSGELAEGISLSRIIRETFPMGSMTGAPKKKVMELIEQYERSRRGIFSGAVGYIQPNGDFDFNVVIRSILYNQQQQYAACLAGSAITFYSNAEEEYEECLLKIAAMRKVFQA